MELIPSTFQKVKTSKSAAKQAIKTSKYANNNNKKKKKKMIEHIKPK